MSELEKLLKAKEVAKVMQVSLGTVYRWIREGKIASVGYGKTVRVPESAVKGRLGDDGPS